MVKKCFLFIFLLLLPTIVYSESAYNFLTRGLADTLYCRINGNCNLSTLTVINTTITNQNITGVINAYGLTFNYTSVFNLFYPFSNPYNFINLSNLSNYGILSSINTWTKTNTFSDTVEAFGGLAVRSNQPLAFSFEQSAGVPIYACNGDTKDCSTYGTLNILADIKKSGNDINSTSELDNRYVRNNTNVNFLNGNFSTIKKNNNDINSTVELDGRYIRNNTGANYRIKADQLIFNGTNTEGSIGFSGGSLVLDGNTSYGDPTISIGKYIDVTGTSPRDSYGRLFNVYYQSYDLSTGSTKYISNYQGIATTGGAQGMRGAQFDVRYAGTQTQTGSLIGLGGQIYHTGNGSTAASYAMFFENNLAANASVSYFAVARAKGTIADGKNGTVNYYMGFEDTGIDAEDGNVTYAYNFYGTNHQKDTGTIINAYGIYLQQQTNGKTNWQIYSPGGNVSFGTGSVTATEYIDLTPAWDDTSARALEAVNKVANKVNEKGEIVINDSTLPKLAKTKTKIEIKNNCKLKCVNETTKEGLREECKEECDITWEEVDARSLGGMVTVHTEAIKELTEKIKYLEVELCKEDLVCGTKMLLTKIGNTMGWDR